MNVRCNTCNQISDFDPFAKDKQDNYLKYSCPHCFGKRFSLIVEIPLLKQSFSNLSFPSLGTIPPVRIDWDLIPNKPFDPRIFDRNMFDNPFGSTFDPKDKTNNDDKDSKDDTNT